MAFVYPEVTYSMPSTTAGPDPLMEPPAALAPLTVGKSRKVSKSQIMVPSRVS